MAGSQSPDDITQYALRESPERHEIFVTAIASASQVRVACARGKRKDYEDSQILWRARSKVIHSPNKNLEKPGGAD